MKEKQFLLWFCSGVELQIQQLVRRNYKFRLAMGNEIHCWIRLLLSQWADRNDGLVRPTNVLLTCHDL